MKLTRSLRVKLQTCIPWKLKANDCIRAYLKQDPSFDQLLDCVKNHRFCKRSIIPSNMFYNQHVRDYWKQFPNGSHDHCVKLWYNHKKS